MWHIDITVVPLLHADLRYLHAVIDNARGASFAWRVADRARPEANRSPSRGTARVSRCGRMAWRQGPGVGEENQPRLNEQAGAGIGSSFRSRRSRLGDEDSSGKVHIVRGDDTAHRHD